MVDIAPTVSAILNIPPPPQAKGHPIIPVVNDLKGRDRLAVLAPDALGLFAWNLWKHEMPYLSRLHAHRSIVLRSVLPSITPVNFATMISGTDQTSHGIATFRDDFTCETLFDVVRREGMRSAGVGLSGYTGCELLGRCADICGDAGRGDDDSIAAVALEIAQRQKPDFMVVQLGVVDDVFHEYGPSSPEVIPMLRRTDERLESMAAILEALDYGILILSDHGQHDVPEAAPGEHLGNHGTDSDIDCQVPFTWL